MRCFWTSILLWGVVMACQAIAPNGSLTENLETVRVSGLDRGDLAALEAFASIESARNDLSASDYSDVASTLAEIGCLRASAVVLWVAADRFGESPLLGTKVRRLE